MHPGKRLVGKVAIVTGGASGIGAETARVFALHGAKVLLTDSNAALGKSVAGEISDSGGTAAFATQDVCDEASWATIVTQAEENHGRLDILCNIAGISGRDPKMNIQTSVTTAGPRLTEQTLEQWNRVMAVNATGVFLGTKAAIPAMRRAGGGCIIITSSVAAPGIGRISGLLRHKGRRAPVREGGRDGVRGRSRWDTGQHSSPRGHRQADLDEAIRSGGRNVPIDPNEVAKAGVPVGRAEQAQDIANGVLWPIFHDQLERLPNVIEGWDTYEAVNARYADMVAACARPGDTIWIHDFQLMRRLGAEHDAIFPQSRAGADGAGGEHLDASDRAHDVGPISDVRDDRECRGGCCSDGPRNLDLNGTVSSIGFGEAAGTIRPARELGLRSG